MPKTLPIQETFAAGEISPRLYGRNSIEGYKAGVESMINYITTPQGPFFRRNGFKFVDGFQGFVFSFMSSLRFPVTYLKLWELSSKQRNWSEKKS